MRNLLILFTLLLPLHQSQAGVGGISGGHVQFQMASAFVNPVYEKTLCYDGENFHAKVKSCVERNGNTDKCAKEVTTWATQPKISSRLRCAESKDSTGECLRWVKVPLVQYPDRYFEFKDENQRVVDRVEFRVKDCP